MKTRFVYIVGMLCAFGLLSACSAIPGQTVSASAGEPAATEISTYKDLSVAEGRLVPGNKLDLAFNAGGRVKEVLAKDGDRVEAGQVLASLDGEEEFISRAAASQVELVQASNELQKMKEDAFVEMTKASVELEDARDDFDKTSNSWHANSSDKVTAFDTALEDYVDADDDVTDAQKKLDSLSDQAKDAPAREQAQERLDREISRRAKAYASLLSEYEAPKEGGVDDKRTRLVDAIARLEAAQYHLDKLNNGIDPDLEALLQARLENAKAAQAAANKQISDLQLTAPWSGTLSNWDLRPDEMVTAGYDIGSLADTSSWMVETTDLAEDDVVDLKVGEVVTMSVNALPGKTFTGKVESIHAKGEKIQGDMTYVVHIKLDQSDPQFYWNMTVKILSDPS